MKHLLLASLITLLAIGTACGQAPEPEPVASNGIHVHGHWTVTVTDPDGTVASVHKFDNALVDVRGMSLLSGLLAGVTTVESHSIDVFRPMDAWACAESVKTTELPYNASDRIPAVFVRDATLAGNPLMLKGACTVTGATEGSSTITQVRSRFNLDSKIPFCLSGMTPAKCGPADTLPLTKHIEDIPVLNNQLVAFNIVFSFE